MSDGSFLNAYAVGYIGFDNEAVYVTLPGGGRLRFPTETPALDAEDLANRVADIIGMGVEAPDEE